MNLDDKKILNFHLTNGALKREASEGLKVAKILEKAFNEGFFSRRNKKFIKNRAFSRGRQPMKEYLDYLNIDGKEAFVNLDMKAPAIAPKFIQVMIGGFMKREEKVRASAVDPVSTERKKIERDNAEFRMNQGAEVAQMEQQFQMELMPKGFTPEDEDELELFFSDYQTPEEIMFEQGVSFVLHQNTWPVIKRKLLEDLIEVGIAGTKTYVAPNGQVKIKRVVPENMIYSFSEYDDFRDLSFIGEVVSKKIVEIRNEYPNMSEDELFKLAKSGKNRNSSLGWQERYRYEVDRPYDDWTVEVIDFEIRTIDSLMYQAKTNKFGNLIVERKEKRPTKVSENKELITKDMFVIYHGVYVLGMDKMLHWGIQKNMIKPSVVKEMADAYFSYSLYMYENLDLENMPIPERMETSIRQMTLAHLKIQQLVAKMRPPGVAVDVDALTDMDLGQGKSSTPLDAQAVYDQTGVLYYKSKNEEGERSNGLPFQELPNSGGAAQLQQLQATYNFYLDRLRAEIGLNEVAEGASLNPRMGVGVAQAQIAVSNNATDFIYEGYLSIFNQTAFKASLLIYDATMYGGEQYREYMGESVKDKKFDIKIQVLPDEKDKQYLEAMIQTALSAQQIEFEDAFKIRHIENVKLAEMYLTKSKKRRQREQMEIAQQNSQMNAEAQQKSIEAKGQSDAQLQQMQSQSKASLIQIEMSMKAEMAEQEFVQNILLKSFETGSTLSPELRMIVDSYMAKKQAKEQAIQQQQMQQMQQMQAQEMEGEGMEEEMQGEEMGEEMEGEEQMNEGMAE